jgi:hypothetical protein
MVPESSRVSSTALALLAAGRVGVGAAILLAPHWFLPRGSGTETLLMRTIGVRDVVLGSAACGAAVTGTAGDLQRMASLGLVSDVADIVVGLRSRTVLDTRSALIATFAPVPFVAAGVYGLARGIRRG